MVAAARVVPEQGLADQEAEARQRVLGVAVELEPQVGLGRDQVGVVAAAALEDPVLVEADQAARAEAQGRVAAPAERELQAVQVAAEYPAVPEAQVVAALERLAAEPAEALAAPGLAAVEVAAVRVQAAAEELELREGPGRDHPVGVAAARAALEDPVLVEADLAAREVLEEQAEPELVAAADRQAVAAVEDQVQVELAVRLVAPGAAEAVRVELGPVVQVVAQAEAVAAAVAAVQVQAAAEELELREGPGRDPVRAVAPAALEDPVLVEPELVATEVRVLVETLVEVVALEDQAELDREAPGATAEIRAGVVRVGAIQVDRAVAGERRRS
jgi:hypothetical protein